MSLNEPSQDWIDDCMHWWGRVLNGTNAHWCGDWDFLPIDDTCGEMATCTCVDDEDDEVLKS